MKEKLSLLTELIKLARCDHEVREQEYEFLLTIAQSINVSNEDFDSLFQKYIGIRIGLNPLATNQVLAEMDKYPEKVIPPEKLIEIFKAHYN